MVIKSVITFIIAINLPQTQHQSMAQAMQIYYNCTGTLLCNNVINATMSNESYYDGLYWGYLSCTNLYMPSNTNGVDGIF